MNKYSRTLTDALWSKRIQGKDNLTPGDYRLVYVLPGEDDDGLYQDYKVIGPAPEYPGFFYARYLNGPYKAVHLKSYADWGIEPTETGYLGQHFVIRIED